jgi:hypothetical protein
VGGEGGEVRCSISFLYSDSVTYLVRVLTMVVGIYRRMHCTARTLR